MVTYTVGRNPGAYRNSGNSSSSSGGGTTSTGNEPPPQTDEERRSNIEKALAKVRKSSPSGTINGATGRSGVKGSYQQTGGGTTSIIAGGGKSKLVPFSTSQQIRRARKAAKPTTKQEIQVSLLKRQGYKVSQEGTNIVAVKGGRKVVITRTGKSATVPIGARVQSRSIPTRGEQRYYKVLQKRKKDKETSIIPKKDVTRSPRKLVDSAYTSSSFDFVPSVQEEKKSKSGFSLKKTLFTERRSYAEFERDISAFEEAQTRFYTGGYFKFTEKISDRLTGGRPFKEKGFFGKTASLYARGIMNIPAGLLGLAIFTPKKAALLGEGLGRKETRARTIEEFTSFRTGAPKKVTKMFDVSKPAGAATMGQVLTFAGLKAVMDVKAGKTPPFMDKTKMTIRTSVYRTPQVELKKTAPVSKAITRKGDSIKISYKRQKVLEKAPDRSTPTIAISRGTIKKGLKTYELKTVQVGRKVHGTIRGPHGKDIIFTKSPKGGIISKELKPLAYDIREVGSAVLKVRKTPYSAETISLKKTAFTRRGLERQVDVGKRLEGGEIVYPIRTKSKTGVYRAIGSTKEFKGLRDIRKSYVSQATTRLTQRDVASRQLELTKIGKSRSIVLKEPDIKYALQPTYKPTTKIYGFDTKVGGIEPFELYLKRPKLVTERITSFQSTTKYTFIQSRAKPVKGLFLKVKGMGKRGELTLGKRGVVVEATKPKLNLYKPHTQPPVSGLEIGGLLKSSYSLSTPILTFPTSVSKSITERETISRSRAESKSIPSSITYSKIESRTQPEVRIEPRVRVQPKTRTKTKVRTRARTVTRSLTMTSFSGGGYGVSSIPKITTPTATIIVPFISDTTRKPRKKKKKKLLRLRGRYTPSLEAVALRKFGKAPKLLTGLELRPIMRL